MGLGWVFLIRGDAGCIVLAYCLDIIVSYWLDRIVMYRLDRIVSDGLYCIIWLVSGNTGFYALYGYWMYGTDGTDGLDGTFVGQGWYGPTLARSGTGSPPLAPERESHHWILRGGRMWELVSGTNCVGAARAQNICVGASK